MARRLKGREKGMTEMRLLSGITGRDRDEFEQVWAMMTGNLRYC